MVGYPRQIMFGAHALVSPQNGLDWKSTKNHEQLGPPSPCLRLSVPGYVTKPKRRGSDKEFSRNMMIPWAKKCLLKF